MAYRPLYTPSMAFDDTRLRDAGHDDMQVSLHRWLVAQPRVRHIGDAEYKMAYAGMEMMLTIEDRVVGFVDVAVRWDSTTPRAKNDRHFYESLPHPPSIYELYEIKPTIGQAGGVLRQLKVLERIAVRALYRGDNNPGPQFGVIAVMRNDDPKLSLLRYMWHGGIVTCGIDPCDGDHGGFERLQDPRLTSVIGQGD